jgi:hypothetical protein
MIKQSMAWGMFLISASSALAAAPWTYRGTLTDQGQAAQGYYDVRLSLLDASQLHVIAGPLVLQDVLVKEGNFSVDVDFGMDLFLSAPLRLKTEVRQGKSAFETLGEPSYFDPKTTLSGVCWDTEGNVGTNPALNFLGTRDNRPLIFKTNNAQSLRIEPSAVLSSSGVPITANVIAGSGANSVSTGVDGASIFGGGIGTPNRVTDSYGAVIGGRDNWAGNASGTADDALDAFVGGGIANYALGGASAVVGGQFNTAYGYKSMVLAGDSNCAGGENSFAAGTKAIIRASGSSATEYGCAINPVSTDINGDEGTFMWADAQDAVFVSTGPNQFLVRADGGFGLNTAQIPTGIEMTLSNRSDYPNVDLYMRTAAHPRGINLAMIPTDGAAGFRIAQFDGARFVDRIFLEPNGDFAVTANAIKPGGGAWATPSDARLKKNIRPLQRALDQLLQLQGVHYEYKHPDAHNRPAGEHVGFIAQEVQKVFPSWVSEDNQGYLTVGPQGFEALAVEAFRELHLENEQTKHELTTQIQQLANQNIQLQKTLSLLQDQVKNVLDNKDLCTTGL